MINFIKLKNFKCFTNESFDLAPLTLLTGVNGLGKSSIIQSLLLLRQSFDSTKLQSQNQVDLFNNSFVDLETGDDLVNEKAYPKEVTIIIDTDSNGEHIWRIDASKPRAEVLDIIEYLGNGNYKKEALFNKDFIYLTAERWGPRKKYSKRDPVRIFNTKLGIQGEQTPSFLYNSLISNEKLHINALKHINASGYELTENLNEWISDILGRSIKVKVSEIDPQNVKLMFNFKGSKGNDFSALQVGFGFSFSLPVILAPLIAKPGDLIIVENPEAHLHPSAQSKVGKLLAIAAENGVQVIMETHSDHVLNGIRVMVKGHKMYGNINPGKIKIHFFSNEDNLTENNFYHQKLDILPSGKITDWPSGFFDEWENNLRDLLK